MSFGEMFLRQPESFPEVPMGQPWGEHSVILDLAGGPYGLTGLSRAQAAYLRGRFESFCLNSQEPVITSRVFRKATDSFREINTRGWEYWLDMDYRRHSIRAVGNHLLARLEWKPVLEGALWTSDGQGGRGIFENFLRLLVAYRLLEEGGGLIHSAAISVGHRAYLFPGESGAGKSTLSRLALEVGYGVLSDDMNALLCSGNGGEIYRLPFTGDLDPDADQGRCFGAQAVYRLEKGPANLLRPMGRAAALALLFSCAPFVNSDPYRREPLLKNLASWLEGIATHVMTFSKAGGFHRLLDRGEGPDELITPNLPHL